MGALREGSLVRLVGLTSNATLNSAEGVVVGRPEGDPPRYPVRLLRPEAVAAVHPEGVRVKRANLQELPRGDAKQPAKGAVAASTAPTAPASSSPGKAKGGAGDKVKGSTASGASASGSGASASLDGAVREKMARMTVQKFLEALDADLYPMEAIERVFGVRMSPQGGRREGDLSTWPIGNLTFGAWITINNWYVNDKMEKYGPNEDEDDADGNFDSAAMDRAAKQARQDLEDELVATMLGARLPAWYEQQLRTLEQEGRASAYAVEIIQRGFRDIPWDVGMLGRIAGRT